MAAWMRCFLRKGRVSDENQGVPTIVVYADGLILEYRPLPRPTADESIQSRASHPPKPGTTMHQTKVKGCRTLVCLMTILDIFLQLGSACIISVHRHLVGCMTSTVSSFGSFAHRVCKQLSIAVFSYPTGSHTSHSCFPLSQRGSERALRWRGRPGAFSRMYAVSIWAPKISNWHAGPSSRRSFPKKNHTVSRSPRPWSNPMTLYWASR